ncbi:MAG: hypothetical protein QM751_15740 [Paludibacteraceae bacterium]
MKEKSDAEKIRLIEEVTIEKNRKRKIEGEGLRNASIVYDVENLVDNLIDCEKRKPDNLLDYLRQINPYFDYEIVDGTYVKARYKSKNVIFCFNNNTLFSHLDSSDKKPLSVYEELSLSIIDDIRMISIKEQEGTSLMYDTTRSRVLKGDEVVVFVYSNKNFITRQTVAGIRKTNFQGYSLVKEFYSIPYDIMSPDVYDHRRTLYWNPDVKTDEKGNAAVAFFNNSSCQTININAETVTGNGVIGLFNR